MDIFINFFSGVFWFLIILIPLIVIHELGHLLMARLSGVRVLEFGVGIPPRWKGKKWKGILWSLNWLPLGGFVRIFGDSDALDRANDEKQRDPKKAKENYIVARLEEILANNDLEMFLEENNLEYNEKWKKIEGFKKKPEELSNEEKEEYTKLLKQLETLIEWEYEARLESKDAFFQKSWAKQSLILFGGILFNLLTAFFIFFFIIGLLGTPVQLATNESISELEKSANVEKLSENIMVMSVSKDGPAYEAGLRPEDEIISINNESLNQINEATDLNEIVQRYKDQEITLTYQKNDTGEIVEANFVPKIIEEEVDGEKTERAIIGISNFGYPITFKAKGIIEATTLSAQKTTNVFLMNFKVLGDVILALNPFAEDRQALDNVGGPVAVAGFGNTIFDIQGVKGILDLMGMISIALAVFNILPIPALDGGRFLIITLNKLLGKRNRNLEMILINITFISMLLLGILVAINDFSKILNGTLI
jgi:regulator of sigma E protease